MSAARVFLLFALLGGAVIFAEAAANWSRSGLVGGNPATWGPPLNLDSTRSNAHPGHTGGGWRFLLMALMGLFVLYLLLG